MNLNEGNYFSTEANRRWMSSSQLKSFLDCPARTIAELNGQYKREETSALLVGSYVDAHFSGTLDQFRATHPEIYNSRSGTQGRVQATEEIIAYFTRIPSLMAMSGRPSCFRKIITGEIRGRCRFRAKVGACCNGAELVMSVSFLALAREAPITLLVGHREQ